MTTDAAPRRPSDPAPERATEIQDWTAAWIAALDRLELDVDDTERLLSGISVSVAESQEQRWTAPTGSRS